MDSDHNPIISLRNLVTMQKAKTQGYCQENAPVITTVDARWYQHR